MIAVDTLQQANREVIEAGIVDGRGASGSLASTGLPFRPTYTLSDLDL
jgi:hypothetical protein